jgi:uncharacterized tellurite resistance protein B-like protein
MANWRKLAAAALLADGRIDDTETRIIRKELFADQKIDKEELEFLNELRNKAKKVASGFTKLFLDGVKNHMLADGVIDDAEARWLRKSIFADGKVDADEVKLLKDLKRAAKKVSKEFDKLYNQCVG